MALTYPLFSNDPVDSGDPKRDLAKRNGYALCLQWQASSNPTFPGTIAERPKNPYLEVLNAELSDAWEEGWSAALIAGARGRGF